MIKPFRMGGFERKLLLVFLVLSVTPTLLIAIFGTRYFAGYVDRLSNVALRESFRNSMEIARQHSIKLEHDAASAAAFLAESFARQRRVRDMEAFLKTVVEQEEADFGALYVRNTASWRLVASHPASLGRLDPGLSLEAVAAETAPQKINFRDQDVVAFGALRGEDSLFVSGLLLEPGMMDMMRKTGEDYSRYSSVGLYVSILRRYSIIVISALVVVMAISSAVASRLLARRISHPIRELAHATERIAEGDLEHRVTVNAKDELGSLVTSFNDMTQELQENKKNLIAMARREAQVARDFEIARQVQQSLFPKSLPSHAGWEFAATCRPARAVGGDYYDIFEVGPDLVLLAQGDVSGKGLGASLVMASVHAIIRSWAGTLQKEPSKLIEELNNYLLGSSTPETFVTLFLGLLDCRSGSLWYVNCGHPPAIVLRASGGRLQDLSVGGPLLGVISGEHYHSGECSLAEGDTVVLVSDGVTEATNPAGEMFEHKRLVETLSLNAGHSAALTMETVISQVEDFSRGCEQADDISVLVIKKKA